MSGKIIEVDMDFVDVDFPACKQFVFGDNGRRTFDPHVFASIADERIELIPRNQWQAVAESIQAEGGGLERLVKYYFDQGREGSCVGQSTTKGLEVVMARQFGEENLVKLSPQSLYKAIGRSPSSGAMLDDAFERINSRGVLPLDTPENRARFGNHVMPMVGWSTPWPSGYETTAAMFKGCNGIVLRKVDELITVLLKQIGPVVVGRQGHSILYLAVIFKNGRMYVLYVNSWGKWGVAFGDCDAGGGFDSESQINMSADWAFCIPSITFRKDWIVSPSSHFSLAS